MRRILLFTTIVFYSFAAKAQPTFTSSDISTTIGTSFVMYGTTPQEPGEPGNEQIWDFSNLSIQNTFPTEVVETGSSDPNADYPEANLIVSYNNGQNYEYYIVSDSAYALYGQFQAGFIEMFYSDPVAYLKFPMNYEDIMEDLFVINYVMPGVTGDINGTYNALVDGYGTLKLPWGDVDAYRITAQVTQTEIFTNANGTYEAFFNGVSTIWFASGFPGPVMIINNGMISVPDLDLEQAQHITSYLGDFNFVGIDEIEIVDDLTVFPNPAADFFNVSFSKSSAEPVRIELYDITGRKLRVYSDIGNGIGKVMHRIDVQDIPAGYYLLMLNSKKGKQGLKIAVR